MFRSQSSDHHQGSITVLVQLLLIGVHASSYSSMWLYVVCASVHTMYPSVWCLVMYSCAYNVPVRVVSGYVLTPDRYIICTEYITRHHTDRYIVCRECISRHHTDRYIVCTGVHNQTPHGQVHRMHRRTDNIQPHTGIRRGMHADK